ncbi:MAG: M12 family metallo-peptidase, partial [Bacteroidota bacterium]|nr:M12 family metallo-peptidase [Bacteroidota bacterium]
MRSILTVSLSFLCLFASIAQETVRVGRVAERISNLKASGDGFQPISLFDHVAPTAITDQLWIGACKEATVLQYRSASAIKLIAGSPKKITLSIPTGFGTLVLDLEQAYVLSDDAIIKSSSGDRIVTPAGLHYRGSIQGSPGSLAAISIYEDELMGILSDATGERIIGKFDRSEDGLHILYHEDDLRGTSGAVCSTPDDGSEYSREEFELEAGERTTRCVGFYWEVAYDIVQNKGGVTDATNYILGLFNQSATLYDNDAIDVVLTEVFVWSSPSPYNATSSSGRLDQFGDTRTSFNGHLANLIDLRADLGGIAWLNTLCSSSYYRMAYSGINSSFQNVPTYSWSVEVITHEQGHSMGSKHTHACAWNGNNTAIDGCGPAAGYTEGGCATGPIPTSSVGGTIMSYCHLTSSTIKFVNGFGSQPTAVITNAINGASCLPMCGTSCSAPTASATVTNISAIVTWSNVGATTYDLQWKLSSSSLWTTVTGITGTSHQLNGLIQGTTYNYRVMANCSSTSSAWSTTGSFTTLIPCTDAYEPNNSTSAATLLSLPASLNALISSGTDVDYYRFTTDQTATITISMTNVSDDFDLRLLNSVGTQLAISQNSTTNSESITYSNASAGTFYLHVYGYNGTFNSQVCYSLAASISGAQGCGTPFGLTTLDITTSTTTVQWNSMQGASSYNLQWREQSASTWNTSANITGTNYPLTALLPGTTYAIRIRANCSAGASLYSSTVNFTTSDDPCGSGVKLGVQVWLDGAFVEADQLMRDDLRVLGYLPLQEPYTAMGYSVGGTLSTAQSRFTISGTNAIVDWILVELRSSSNSTQVLSTRAGLLRRDGAIVSAEDGASQINFCVPNGNYFISVRHRNHLACMTASAIALTSNGSTLDLRNGSTTIYGTSAQRSQSGITRLWAGNSNADQNVKFSGINNDRDVIISLLGGVVPTSTLSGYHIADLNLDGIVKYTGSSNDRDVILTTI